jgi:hypothetical protein
MEQTPPQPPRLTGDADVDRKIVDQWQIDFYKVTVLNNPRDAGTFTVSGDTTTAEVSLSFTQADADYRVAITAVSTTGAPADGAFTVKSVDKTAIGFTVTVLAAPGTDAGVTYDWQVQR